MTAEPAPVDSLDAALRLLYDSLGPAALDGIQPADPRAVYTPAVVVWLMVYQRLRADAPLTDAVSEFLRVSRDARPERRPSARVCSANTGAYSRARTRLLGSTADRVCDLLADRLIETSPPALDGRRAYALDGTTVTLPTSPELILAFPPASNQHGQSAWPVLQLLVAHELASGCATRPELGPMYGPAAESELSLAVRLLARLPARSVLLADRNFGVYAFAQAAVGAGHDVLLRLTEPRFRMLKRGAKPAGPGIWTLRWKPSAWERKRHPGLAASLDVRLAEVEVREGLTLWLVTTLSAPAARLAEVYLRRLDVETDIRDVKVALKIDRLSGRSESMIRKEVAMAFVAYNLVAQVRRLAAGLAGLEPRRLSFSGTWSLVTTILLWGNSLDAAGWRSAFELVLRAAAQRKVPRRPGRSYPRELIARRRKYPERRRKTSKAKPM